MVLLQETSLGAAFKVKVIKDDGVFIEPGPDITNQVKVIGFVDGEYINGEFKIVDTIKHFKLSDNFMPSYIAFHLKGNKFKLIEHKTKVVNFTDTISLGNKNLV